MPDAVSIDRRIALPPALDYAFLREAGLEHIRHLSSELWTDHNLHDPGITTLEILCYALTDLAYRAGFEAKDLLSDKNGQMDPPSRSGLAPAHEVLTTAPRTIADYRRLLLRIDGVRNAWLDPMTDPAEPDNYRRSEVAVYADHIKGGLSFDPRNATGRLNKRVGITGLYAVRLELDIDDRLGPLSEAGLVYQVRRGPLKGVVLAFECRDPALLAGALELSRTVTAVTASVAAAPRGFGGTVTLTMDGVAADQVMLTACTIRVIEHRPRPDQGALVATAPLLKAVLEDLGGDGPLPLFWEKQGRRARAIEAVTCVLHANRGLCEDFLSVSTVQPWRIAICADIAVTPDADLEQVQAAVVHAIELYLSAPVRYRTLEETLDEGRSPDEIFNGPFVDFGFTCDGRRTFTKPGFITDEDLARSELRREVRVSDIINLVVEIPGVEAISGVRLRHDEANGGPAKTSATWTLDVPPGHQPVLDLDVSKLLFLRAGIPYRAQDTEFQRTLDHLRAMERRSLHVPPDQVLPTPIGRWRHLDTFTSVQHDFPATYKIGTARIAATESNERIAQARQLKGYLTFFDQLLADYLGQLRNLRELYSLDKNVQRTWFSQQLQGIAPSREDDFASEFFIGSTLSKEDERTRLTESDEAFLERRNRALDHLLARFAERFADYAMMSFTLSGNRLHTSKELIDEKIDFLADYPRQSRERGQAANLRPESPGRVWNSDNISGLERRVGRLLGFGTDQLKRRDLHCAAHFGMLFVAEASGAAFRVAIRDDANNALFASQETFPDAGAALDVASSAYNALRDTGASEIAGTQGAAPFTLRIVSGDTPLTHDATFPTEVDATRAARVILDRYDELLQRCGNPPDDPQRPEGMHLIEHVLLRPGRVDDPLMRVCLDDGECACGDDDPYSFRISVVLPYWTSRNRNMAFRALFERTIREEAPAHVQVKVCWIGQRQMIDLDKAFREWLTSRAAASPNPTTVRRRTKRLIEVLESLTTVYLPATLHNCKAGEQDTPVRLGSTALGIFRRSSP